MSKPVSEGDIAGRRREREGGGVSAAAAASATVCPVSRLLLAWQAGGTTERERTAERQAEKEPGQRAALF